VNATGPQRAERAGGGIVRLPCFRPVEPREYCDIPVQAFMSAQTPIMRRLLIVAALAAALAFPLGVPARAQAAVAPFDGSLQRLAEILGALHYLRNVCGANEGQKWRNEMQSLIDAEAPSGDRRLRMIASFNRGYRGYQQSYRTCTPAAELVIRRYLEEGSKIAREMTARYAN
jgi:uncharacterized protein (TIGR02301 family)